MFEKLLNYKILAHDLKKSDGFTLLEVMVAVSILAISLVVIYGSQSRSLSYSTEAHFSTLAPILAASKFAELESQGEITDNDGDFGDNYPGYMWKLIIEDASFEDLDALNELDTPLVRAELSVVWSDSNMQYNLVYYGRW